MLILPISKKLFGILLSRKISGNYREINRYQDIKYNNKIISGKE